MCGDSNILTVIYFLKVFIDILQIGVPIILILMVAIDLGKMVMSSEGYDSKTVGKITKRMIGAAFVFFVPALVSFLFSLIGSDSDSGLSCWTNVTQEDIELAKVEEKLEDDKEQKAIEEEKKKADEERKRLEEIREEQRKENEENAKEEEEENNNNDDDDSGDDWDDSTGNIKVPGVPTSKYRTPFVNGVQRALKTGECMSQEDKCFCPTVGNAPGFQFTMVDETSRNFSWVSSTIKTVHVKVECSDGTSISKYVIENGASRFKSAFEKICKLKTTGISGVKINPDLLYIDGVYVKRLVSSRTSCSPHAYANAIDINYNMEVTVNGTKYKPWAGQGANTKKKYTEFVNALGREDDPRNVNYILWKYAFEPSGFVWGGNWSDGSFDPMHFELK